MENLSDDYDREPPAKFVKDVIIVDELMMQIWAEFSILEQEDSNLKTVCTLQTTEAECVDNEAECVIDNEAFHVCDDHVFIDLSDKPNGGSGSYELQGKHGSLKLYYVAVKYAVVADLEVEFCATSKETKATGTVMAYYGQDFDYDDPEFNCEVTLFEATSPAFVTPGRIKLMRSVLAVPAKSSLIIAADLYESTSSLFGTCEFHVPRDCRSSYGSIVGEGWSLKLKVNWKQPSEELKIPSSSSNSSSVSRLLGERRAFAALTMADPDERNRWSLQGEIAKVFNTSLKKTFKIQEAVPCCISTCTKEDGGDYLCSSVLHIWPEIKNTRLYKGPKHAGLAVKDNITGSDYKDVMERCVVCGPGFVKFKLCRKWIAKSIHTMLIIGIETWAPKLPVEKAIIYVLSQNIDKEMNMGHLRSTFIGETLARTLEYSGVVVLQKRIHDNIINPDIKDKSFCESYTRNILDLFREKGLLIGSEGYELPLVDLTAFWHDLCLAQADCVVHVGKRYSLEMCISAAASLAGRRYPALIHAEFGLVHCDDFETEVDKLVDLLDEAKSRCKALLVGQGMADEWTAAEHEHVAEALEYGALKYAHLKNNRLTNHTFSFDQMLNEEGNTAVYLHYTHARICSIIRNSNKDIKELTAESLILKHDDERELGLHLLRFTEVLREVCTILTPHILCDYLYGLCKKFKSLDSSVSQVVGSSEETSKLLLCKATEVVMRKCFDLLGITPIHKIYR